MKPVWRTVIGCAALLLATDGRAALVSFDLDQSAELPDGQAYLRVTIDDQGLPPAELDQATVDPEALAQRDLQPFFRHCRACHLSREASPPNFLAGNAQQVADNLRRCAPRMLVRLSAWRTPIEQRIKSPMPPVTALHGLGTTTEHWTRGSDLAELRGYVEALTQQQGHPTDVAALLKNGYEALPGCLSAH